MPSTTKPDLKLIMSPAEIQAERIKQNVSYAMQVEAEIADAFQLPSPTPKAPMPDTPATGLPVAGYKPTQPDWAIQLVNQNKHLEEAVLRQIDKHVRDRNSSEIDQRNVALARTEIENAFMRLNRAVFQPTRVSGELKLDFLEELKS